jgi:hypothetical protein
MAGAVMFYRITFPFRRLRKGSQSRFGRIIEAPKRPIPDPVRGDKAQRETKSV